MPIGNEGGKKKIFAKALNANKVKELVNSCSSSRKEIADELGISITHLTAVLSGSNSCSKTLDVAAEGLLRRMGKDGQIHANGVKNYIVQIQSTHADTISTLVKTLGGKVQELQL